MTVEHMINRHLSKYSFIVQENATGETIFDEKIASYLLYKELKDKEVKGWGIHNTKDKTIILYI